MIKTPIKQKFFEYLMVGNRDINSFMFTNLLAGADVHLELDVLRRDFLNNPLKYYTRKGDELLWKL